MPRKALPPQTSASGIAHSATLDPGVARDWLAAQYTSHELHFATQDAGFDFLHISAPLREGSANFLRYGREVEVLPGAFPGFYMLEMPITGGVTVSLDGEGDCSSSPTTALFLPPNRPLASVWRPRSLQFMLKLNAAEVLRRWQDLVGRRGAVLPVTPPEIEFQSTEGWRVQQSMLLLKAEFERGLKERRCTLQSSPLSAAVIDSVLHYIRAHHGLRVEPEQKAAMPGSLHKCLAYFSAHLREDITLADLVRLTGVSERSLFNQFEVFLHSTPKRYLEQKRLAVARNDLLQGARSVAEAAQRAGLNHLGRFSQRYFETYGEKPSETLRQALSTSCTPYLETEAKSPRQG